MYNLFNFSLRKDIFFRKATQKNTRQNLTLIKNTSINYMAHPTNPVGGAVLMLTQKHVAKRYMIAKKVVPLHYESEWQYKYV